MSGNRGPANPGLAKVQHYVPQCLLRGFASGKSDQVWVLDKSNDKPAFQTAIRNVAAEKDFYNFDTPDGVASLEPVLSHIEDRAAGVLRRVRREGTLSSLTLMDEAVLALFTAVQIQRTQSFRLKIADTQAQLAVKMGHLARQQGATEEKVAEALARDIPQGEAAAKAVSLGMIGTAPNLVPLLLSKIRLVAKAAPGTHFYLSDNPVAMYNEIDHGPYGNIGLAVRGIQIFLPISSDLLLFSLCQSYESQFRANAAGAQALLKNVKDGAQREELELMLSLNQSFVTAMDTGDAMVLSPDVVLRANWLQVVYGERFLFSKSNDFDVVREMIEKNP